MVFNLRTFSFSSVSEDDPRGPTPPKSFSLKELQVATHNFSHDNILYGGGFGRVYRGRLSDGSLVAVKRAHSIRQLRKEQFKREVRVGSSVPMQPNLPSLRGFCRTRKELLLIYPLMIHKSLDYYLDQSIRPLDWTTRKLIALEAARGLASLHDQGNFKIVHRNICPSSILLNAQFEAVIGDVSIAVVMHEKNADKGTIEWPISQVEVSSDSDSHCQTCHHYEDVYVKTEVVGRVWFLAPEYLFTGKCTLKNDVFDYGKMLLELISGQRIWEFHRLACVEGLIWEEWVSGCMNKNQLDNVIDPDLQGNYLEEEAEQLVQWALLCADPNPSVRPKMSEVVTMLKSQTFEIDPSGRSSLSPREYDSTGYYASPPPSLEVAPP